MRRRADRIGCRAALLCWTDTPCAASGIFPGRPAGLLTALNPRRRAGQRWPAPPPTQPVVAGATLQLQALATSTSHHGIARRGAARHHLLSSAASRRHHGRPGRCGWLRAAAGYPRATP